MLALRIVLLALLPGFAPFDPAQDAPEAGPRAVIEDLAGARRLLPLTGVELRDLAELAGVLVSFEGVAPIEPGPQAERAVVRMVGGGRALGLVRGGEEEWLRLELMGGAILRLSISEIESLVFPGRVPADWTGALVAPKEGDLLFRYRAGGLDRIAGAVEQFTATGVRFDSSLGSKDFPWSEVSALFIEVLDEEPAPESKASTDAKTLTVDLFEGTRLRGTLIQLDATELRLETLQGRGLRLPLGTIAEILVEDPGLRFLSELEPTRVVEPSPFGDELGMRWPYQVDAAVGGGALRSAGRTYTRGIGVHAPSQLTWELDGAWRALRGAVAVDDEVLRLAARGSVRFQVICDGDLRWQSPVVSVGEGPLPLPEISLEGVDELTLAVEMGDDWVADRADWLRMILVR